MIFIYLHSSYLLGRITLQIKVAVKYEIRVTSSKQIKSLHWTWS